MSPVTPDSNFNEPTWSRESLDSPMAAKVQHSLAQSLRFSRSRWGRLFRFSTLPVIPIRECGWGIRNSAGSNRNYILRDRSRRSVGEVKFTAVRVSRNDHLAAYCGVLLWDGTTFELTSQHARLDEVVGSTNGLNVWTITKEASPASEPSGLWAQIKDPFTKPRMWNIALGNDHLGRVIVPATPGSSQRRAVFELDDGAQLPIQTMRPKVGLWGFDAVVPDDSPTSLTAEIAVTHFILNVAFRIFYLALDF